MCRNIAGAGSQALDDLVKKINDSLGPQFHRFIEQVKAGFVNLFGPTILADGQSLLNLLRGIGEVFGALPAPVVMAVAQFLALAGAIKALTFAGALSFSILGGGALLNVWRGTATGAGAAAGQMVLFGESAVGAGVGARALATGTALAGAALKTFLPVAIIGLVLELASALGSAADNAARLADIAKTGGDLVPSLPKRHTASAGHRRGNQERRAARQSK